MESDRNVLVEIVRGEIWEAIQGLAGGEPDEQTMLKIRELQMRWETCPDLIDIMMMAGQRKGEIMPEIRNIIFFIVNKDLVPKAMAVLDQNMRELVAKMYGMGEQGKDKDMPFKLTDEEKLIFRSRMWKYLKSVEIRTPMELDMCAMAAYYFTKMASEVNMLAEDAEDPQAVARIQKYTQLYLAMIKSLGVTYTAQKRGDVKRAEEDFSDIANVIAAIGEEESEEESKED